MMIGKQYTAKLRKKKKIKITVKIHVILKLPEISCQRIKIHST